MLLIELFGVATERGCYIVSYICDGWLKETKITAETPRQLLLRWQNFTEKQKLNINCITAIERGN